MYPEPHNSIDRFDNLVISSRMFVFFHVIRRSDLYLSTLNYLLYRITLYECNSPLFFSFFFLPLQSKTICANGFANTPLKLQLAELFSVSNISETGDRPSIGYYEDSPSYSKDGYEPKYIQFSFRRYRDDRITSCCERSPRTLAGVLCLKNLAFLLKNEWFDDV